MFANAAAEGPVNGVDIWEINANETVFNQYSRYNYDVATLFTARAVQRLRPQPGDRRAQRAPVEPATRQIQILGTNDFHGRLRTTRESDGWCRGAVRCRQAAARRNPDTVFAAAGDLIGASTFESFIQKDKPTIDALNEAGLEVSAAGNHEFDQGYNDLVNRVMAPYDARPTRRRGELAVHRRQRPLKVGNTHALIPTWTKDFGRSRSASSAR